MSAAEWIADARTSLSDGRRDHRDAVITRILAAALGIETGAGDE